MDIIQKFYDNMAAQYDKLFFDWEAATSEQAVILDRIFRNNGFDSDAKILDCACGIGTQCIGIARLGYHVTASDISECEIFRAKQQASKEKLNIRFERADFCALSDTFTDKFDIIIAMDNALPHMLSADSLKTAISSIESQISKGGIFIASIRDYDLILEEKPPYSPPYIHKTDNGQRVCFQTWDWSGDIYTLTQYIIEDEKNTEISKFECKYRAVRREELTDILLSCGFVDVEWKSCKETGFYQPIFIARR